MLINVQQDVKAGDVVAFKLVSGEDILAKLVAVDGDDYTIVRPVILHLVPTGNGQASVSFAPFSLGVDDEAKLTFNFSKLLYRPIQARKDAASQYIRSTTGLEVASQGIVV